MNNLNIFLMVYGIGSITSFLFSNAIDLVQFFYRKKHGSNVPDVLASKITPEEIKKISCYNSDSYFVQLPMFCVSNIVKFVMLVFGMYAQIFYTLQGSIQNIYGLCIVFMLIDFLIQSIISLPFHIYGEFVIEKKYGFSNMTARLFIADMIKIFIINTIITAILVSLITVIIEHFTFWYLIFPTVFLLFSLLITFIYPFFIEPLFNKVTPLEDGEVKNMIIDYAQKAKFIASGIFVLDDSKRSSHSNAYFSGFGKTKRIVLSDTILKQLSPAEIAAVVAHELGHYKKHHVIKMFIEMAVMVYAAFFLVKIFVDNALLYTAFGFSLDENNMLATKLIGVFLCLALVGAFSVFVSIIQNTILRRYEYEADAYAKKICNNKKDISSALIKIHTENKVDIHCAKIYSQVKYDHPTLLERLDALSR